MLACAKLQQGFCGRPAKVDGFDNHQEIFGAVVDHCFFNFDNIEFSQNSNSSDHQLELLVGNVVKYFAISDRTPGVKIANLF